MSFLSFNFLRKLFKGSFFNPINHSFTSGGGIPALSLVSTAILLPRCLSFPCKEPLFFFPNNLHLDLGGSLQSKHVSAVPMHPLLWEGWLLSSKWKQREEKKKRYRYAHSNPSLVPPHEKKLSEGASFWNSGTCCSEAFRENLKSNWWSGTAQISPHIGHVKFKL